MSHRYGQPVLLPLLPLLHLLLPHQEGKEVLTPDGPTPLPPGPSDQVTPGSLIPNPPELLQALPVQYGEE